MKINEIAKKLLEEKTCKNCKHNTHDNFCILFSLKSGIKEYSFPKENTCEDWINFEIKTSVLESSLIKKLIVDK
jgi:hypothetical protein